MSKGLMAERSVVCVKCGTEFKTRHSQGKYCSPECARLGERASWREYGNRNRERRRAFHQQYYEANRDSVLRRTRTYQKSERGHEVARIAHAKAVVKFPEKVAARQAVSAAVSAGRLVPRPCVRCGAPKVHGHHEDYSKPLEVVWLCKDCHAKRHKELREMERQKEVRTAEVAK